MMGFNMLQRTVSITIGSRPVRFFNATTCSPRRFGGIQEHTQEALEAQTHTMRFKGPDICSCRRRGPFSASPLVVLPENSYLMRVITRVAL